jgi:hypothetical protein
MGSSSQKTSSSTQTQPWSPTIPTLNNLIGDINGLSGNYQPNATETSALNQITQNAQNLPNYGAAAGNVAGNFLTGDPSGMLGSAYANYQGQMNPVANAPLDPTQTPGIASLLDTIRGDVSNSVNSLFAGAGRDLSGLNSQYLARGIAQGEAQPLLNQYNQNVTNRQNAANGLLSGAISTSGAMGQNQAQGFNMAQLVPSLVNQGPNSVLAAQAQARGLPIQNLAQLESLILPIAGLGQQGTGSQSTTSTAAPWQIATGLLGVL